MLKSILKSILKPIPASNPLALRTIRAFYFMAGMGASIWAFIVPFSKTRFQLPDSTLGLILLAPGLGGILAMPAVGVLVQRYGSRAVLLVSSLLFALLVPLLTIAPNVAGFTCLLFLFGITFGGVDIGINAQAVAAEASSGQRLMSSCHAAFSIGALAVALATSLLLALGVSQPGCGLAYGGAILAVLSQGGKLLPPVDDLPSSGPALSWPNRATLMLGLCCLVCFLTEAAITDWSTIFLRFSRAASISQAPYGYAGFALTMVASRLGGDRLTTRLGAPRMAAFSCALAACGLLLAACLPGQVAAIAGFAVAGAGLGNLAPLILGAAARVPGMSPTASAPAVLSLGYAGFLLGPVIIGLIASSLKLSFAFGLVALLLAITSLAARAIIPL